MNTNLHKASYLLLSLFLLSGCGGSSGGSSNGGAVSLSANPITIDNAGTIPLINGSGTSTLIYVHNNSKYNITGIKYTSVENKQESGNVLIDISSAKNCVNIPAGGACSLSITAPALTLQDYQGSAFITASYKAIDGKSRTFNQVVNYQYVSSNTINGVQFSGATDISGFGNDVGYATVYLYGTGKDQLYNIKDLSSNKAGVTIINGNVKGKQIQSGYVQAVEVKAATASATIPSTVTKQEVKQNITPTSYLATLTAISQATSGGPIYTATAMLGVNPVANGPLLVTGLAPVINTNISLKGSLYIVNSGNATATGVTYVPGTGITAGDNSTTGSCTDSGSLLPGQGCTYHFSVLAGSGSSSITVNYGASSLIQTVTWYNQVDGALLDMSVTPNPLNFENESATATVTVTNIGGYSIKSLTIAEPIITGLATAESSSVGNTCQGESLDLGASCSYQINVVDYESSNTSGTVLTGVSGKYTTLKESDVTYLRKLSFNYSAYGKVSILTIAPNTTTMNITGNATDIATQVFKITNDGTQTVNLTGYYLSGNPSYMIVDNESALTTCSNSLTLHPTESCDVVVKLGAVTTSSNVIGQATLLANYTGGQGYSNSALSLIDYTVTPAEVDLTLTSVVAADTACFMGSSNTGLTSGAAYQLNGGFCGYQQAGDGSITITYTNSGTAPLVLVGMNESNLGNIWQLNNNKTTCLLGNNLVAPVALAPLATCVVVFDYVLPQYGSSIGNIGAAYTVNLELPSFILNYGGSQFTIRPTTSAPDTVVYANSNQVTVTNSTTYENEQTKVQHTIANTVYNDGVNNHELLSASVNATSLMEDYFGSIESMNGCNYSMADGILNQNCAIAANTAGGTLLFGKYNVAHQYDGASLHVIYGISTGTQLVASTPRSERVNLFELLDQKTIFLTVNSSDGNTTGISGADDICQAEATGLSLTGTYKALMVDGVSRIACTTANCNNYTENQSVDWVLKQNTAYYNLDNELVQVIRNPSAIFKFPLDFNITDEVGIDAWTGFNTNWTSATNNCSDFSDNDDALEGATGLSSSVTSSFIFNLDLTCDTQAHLICVQQ